MVGLCWRKSHPPWAKTTPSTASPATPRTHRLQPPTPPAPPGRHPGQEGEGDEPQVGVDRCLADRVEHPAPQVAAGVERVAGQQHRPRQHHHPARGDQPRHRPPPLAAQDGAGPHQGVDPDGGQAAGGEGPDGMAAVDCAQLDEGQRPRPCGRSRPDRGRRTPIPPRPRPRRRPPNVPTDGRRTTTTPPTASEQQQQEPT